MVVGAFCCCCMGLFVNYEISHNLVQADSNDSKGVHTVQKTKTKKSFPVFYKMEEREEGERAKTKEKAVLNTWEEHN